MAAIIWVVILAFVYVGVYLANKKTPKPKDCENITAECHGCNLVGCSHHPANHEEE